MEHTEGRTRGGEAQLTNDQLRACALFLRVRHVVIVLSGVSAYFNAALGPRATHVAFALWFGMLPYNEVLVRVVRRRRRVPFTVAWVDLAAVLAAGVYEPTLFLPGMILALGNLPLPAAVLSTRHAWAVGVAAIVGFVGVAILTDVADPVSYLVAFALAVPVMFIVVILLSRREVVETRRRADLLEAAGAFSWEYDTNRRVFNVLSGPLEEMLGVTVAQCLEDPAVVMSLLHPDDERRLLLPGTMRRLISGESSEVRLRRATGADVDPQLTEWTWWRFGGVRLDGAGRLSGMLINTTDLHGAHEAMRVQAMTDLLTGLANRASICADVTALYEAGREVSLLLIDIDRFKEVNDALGHHVGDLLLVGIAQRLRDLGGIAITGRLGGDEFVVVFVDDRAATAADHAADVHEHLTQPFDTGGLSLVVGASVGIARRGPACPTAEDLFRGADAAMYQAKRAGGGVVEFVRGATRDSNRSVRLLSDLHRRLIVDGLDIALQPIVSASSGRIVGAEALARWQHHQLGAISPAEFIPLAEMSGQIHRLAQSVLRQAIVCAAGWHASGHPLTVSVNLSATNLLSGEVMEVIERLPAEVGLPWSALVLEITETQVMEQSDLVGHALERFARLGVRLSIDDFGTGHSSLSRLRQMPFDEMKVDRSFVSGVDSGGIDAAIIAAIVSVGHGTGMSVVAEGVETKEQIDIVTALGCDLLQGFGLHRPMSNEAFTQLLASMPRAAAAPIAGLNGSGAGGVIAAVDVDHFAGGRREPVAQ